MMNISKEALPLEEV